jgi:hypothetical protein
MAWAGNPQCRDTRGQFPGLAPEALADALIDRDVRRAVEGGLKGWHRLRRFQAAMTFPLSKPPPPISAPSSPRSSNQFRRLEHNIGARLYRRFTPRQPMRPTQRGTALLHALSRPDIQALAAAQAAEQPPSAHRGGARRFGKKSGQTGRE